MAVHDGFFICGGVLVGIDGCGRERFFNIAAQRGLAVCEVSTDAGSGEVTFRTTVRDFKRMWPVAKKTGVRLRIRGKYGLPFFLYRNRGRKLFVAGSVAFFLILYTLSLFIWDISFEGNRRFTDEMLLHYMETIPVVCGMRKSEISCDKLENAIRDTFDEITWVSAELAGTRLTVRIRENDAVLVPPEPDTEPCDLSAALEGTVVRAVTRSGLCQVKVGDPVTAGTLLVSGTIPILDDNGTVVNEHRIHADAEIYARTVHDYEERLPLSRTVSVRTGRVRHGFTAGLFGTSFSFLEPDLDALAGPSDRGWQTVSGERQLKIFHDFYLPVYGGPVTAYEYVPHEEAYTEDEVRRFADRKEKEYIENLSEKGIQILGSNDKIEKSGSEWRIRIRITAIEDIAAESPIPPAEEPESQEENHTVNEHY